MQRVIFKYVVQPKFTLQIPADAQVLSVQPQHGDAYMWILLDPDAPNVARTFQAIPTGQPFEATNMRYIGTFLVDRLVFHLFEVL